MIAASLMMPESAWAQPAGKRVALVVGNGAYLKLGRLKNPANDAQDVGAALKKLGFDTEIVVDAGVGAMADAVERFAKRLSGADAGLFFYAGHGVQASGANFLVPTDADIQGEFQLRYKAIQADMVLDSMNASGCALNIVILDACRDNPFGSFRSATRGLAVTASAPTGAVIAYATDPGKTAADGSGRNGVFTEALLRHIATPGLDVKALFDRVGSDVATATKQVQTPWVSSKYYGTYYLAGAAPAVVQPPQAAVSASPRGAGVAELLVSTLAPGAEIFVDGMKVGMSGEILPIAAGAEISVKAKLGYAEGEARLVPTAGKLHELSIGLELPKGNLLVKTGEAENARFFLDGKDIGAFGKGLFRDLPAGDHEYSIRGKGVSAQGRVTIAPRGTTTVAASLVETGSLRIALPAGCVASAAAQGFGPVELRGGGQVENVPVGRILVTAKGPGRETASAELAVRRGEETLLALWTKAFLSVDSIPPGATVLLDGVERGTTPLTTDLEAESPHRVELRLDKHEPYQTRLSVGVGKQEVVMRELRGLPASILVETIPAGAAIHLDDSPEVAGTSPCLLENLAPGEHRISIEELLDHGVAYAPEDNIALTVGLGERKVLSREMEVGKATLKVEGAPAGSRLELGIFELPAAVFGEGVQILAGQHAVSVKAPGGLEWKDSLVIRSGTKVSIGIDVMRFVLQKRSIKIDGKMDDWAGIQQTMSGTGDRDKAPGEPGTRLAKGFACYDDKYFYWAMEFADGKPENTRGLEHKLLIGYGGDWEANLSVQVSMDKASRFSGVWDKRMKLWHDSGIFSLTPSGIEVRFPISALPKGFSPGAAVRMQMEISRSTGEGQANWFLLDQSTVGKVLIAK
jgi:hypothetical protein